MLFSGRYWQIRQTGSYKNSINEGELNDYYNDGRICGKAHFSSGKPDGEQIAYYHTGKVGAIGLTKSGIKPGDWKYYDSTGVEIKAFPQELTIAINSLPPIRE